MTEEDLKKISYIPAEALGIIIENDLKDLFDDMVIAKYTQAERIIKIKQLQKKIKELIKRSIKR